MDQTAAKIVEFFKHLHRDLLIYVLSGFVVIANLYILDDLINDGKIFEKFADTEYKLLVFIVAAYIIGHIINLLSKLFFKNSDNSIRKNEYRIYLNRQDVYEYFINRYNTIYLMWMNLCFAFILNAVVDFVIFYCMCLSNLYILYISCFLFFLASCCVVDTNLLKLILKPQ